MGLQQLLSLAGEVEGGCVRLQALEMRHPLLGSTALKQQAYSHYLRAAVPQIVKLLGSANLLGTPLPQSPSYQLKSTATLSFVFVGLSSS